LIQAQRLYHVKATPAKVGAGEALVQQFIRQIDRHYLTRQSVQEYADLLAVTAGHLSDSTREVLGVPASYLIHQRLIVEAKRLLLHTEQSAGEIGQQLGFSDPSYFARFFKRETKLSPRVFRDSFRKKYQLSRAS
jgi:AraC family transcriptional activator of pobA